MVCSGKRNVVSIKERKAIDKLHTIYKLVMTKEWKGVFFPVHFFGGHAKWKVWGFAPFQRGKVLILIFVFSFWFLWYIINTVIIIKSQLAKVVKFLISRKIRHKFFLAIYFDDGSP